MCAGESKRFVFVTMVSALMFIVTGLSLQLGTVLADTGLSSKHLAELEHALHRELLKHDQHEEPSKDTAAQRNVNKNYGLINTIVNHNNKLKHIENKFNVMINNFANSSHVKEVVEKNKEIERHIFGAPQPLKSWREMLLCILLVGVLVFALYGVFRKYVRGWIRLFIQKNALGDEGVSSRGKKK